MARLATGLGLDGPLSVSVVIPTLNEAARLPRLLEALSWMPVHQVIVADGGSTDDTEQAARRAGVTWLACERRGRAQQMNAGADLATGTVLWFLHADAVPPVDAVAGIRTALDDPHTVGGAFLLHTVPDQGRLSLGPLLRIADVRSRYTRHPYGDQGVFVRRATFERMGGFADLALLEDLEFATRLRTRGRVARVRSEVRASGRRFENRPLASFLMMQAFPVLYRMGVSTERLARWYRHER